MAQQSHIYGKSDLNAKLRLIRPNTNDPKVLNTLKRGLKATKRLISPSFLWRLFLGVVIVSAPLYASAGLFSFIAGLFSSVDASTKAAVITSQNMALLQSVPSADLALAQGGGDITIVGNSALLPDSGPSGSSADILPVNSSGQISVYVVRDGDTLSQIAKMYGVSTNTIAWNNDIQKGTIHPGQTLIILPISGIQHTVVKGDTISSLAKKYRADAGEIAGYNGLSESDSLAVGSVVIIPDGELTPVATSPVTSNLRGAGGPDYGSYYMRPISGGTRSQGLHGYNAVDLATYTGAPIFAAAGGTVIVARSGGWNGGYGSYVVIQHPNNTQTLYGHMSQVDVAQGQQVVRGQVIGLVGATGKATGPHVHFEVRGAQNPFGR